MGSEAAIWQLSDEMLADPGFLFVTIATAGTFAYGFSGARAEQELAERTGATGFGRIGTGLVAPVIVGGEITGTRDIVSSGLARDIVTREEYTLAQAEAVGNRGLRAAAIFGATIVAGGAMSAAGSRLAAVRRAAGQRALRGRVLGNLAESAAARRASWFKGWSEGISGGAGAARGRDLFMNRAPLARTLNHGLNPQSYIDDVAKHYGINLRGTKAVYDPTLAPGQPGVTRAAEGGRIVRIGPDALAGQATLANTIAHELSHARDFLRGAHKAHGTAASVGDGTVYGAGNALEAWIRGN